MFVGDMSQGYNNADTISIDTLALEESLQEERAKETIQLVSMSKKVSYLHTSLLYYRDSKSKISPVCYELWKTVLKRVGGTPSGWRELGCTLGISQEDIDYIANTVKAEPADVVLKVFIQNEKATLDKLLDAFVKLKRYDILKAIEEPLCALVQFFNKDDSGYHSHSKENMKGKIISFTKNLCNDLPPALNKNVIIQEKEPNRYNEPLLRPLSKVGKKNNDEERFLFLTFTADGHHTAINIQNLMNGWIDMPDITVVTLNDRREEVYQNPEKFIREYFEKAEFVVPIVSLGYLNEIRSNNASVSHTNDCLDYKYVHFIYTLIVNYYIHGTGCLNKKVRSVIPENVNGEVLSRISMYPDLMPWTFETNFNRYFKAFLSKDYL